MLCLLLPAESLDPAGCSVDSDKGIAVPPVPPGAGYSVAHLMFAQVSDKLDAGKNSGTLRQMQGSHTSWQTCNFETDPGKPENLILHFTFGIKEL